MNYTKGEQKLRDKIRDACAYNGAGVISATYADAVMGIPLVKAAPELYEALIALSFQFAVAVEKPYSKDKVVYEQAQQAISKAEGK